MKMTKVISVTVICCFIAIYAKAQNADTFPSSNTVPWSLERCIEYAKEHNLQIKQNQLSVQQAQNNILQSRMDFLPSIDASASHNMSWGRSVNMQTLEIINNKLSQSSSFSTSASETIFSGFAKVNTLKGNKMQLQISEQQVEKLKNDITIQITRAYLQVLLSQELEKTARENMESIAQQVEKSKQLVDAGSQAYSTLLEMKAQYANEASTLVDAQNSVRTNLLTLTQLLDLHPTDAANLAVVKPAENADTLYKGEEMNLVYAKALELPQIKAAELTLDKSRLDLKVQQARLYPSISASAGYGTFFTDGQGGAFFPQLDKNKQHSLGFSLNIPIFNGFGYRTNVKNAKLAVENSRIDLEIQKQNLYKDVQTAYNEEYSALQKVKAAKVTLESTKESFTYTENKFNVGALSGTDYRVAKANLFKAQSDFLQAKYQYLFESKILDFYKGIPITL
ncbi:MAG TPA: TolC family protein [Candidatus Egerieousia sp.]|nr:TolC family protein [Candidatus Egerieousia sp.]HPT05522.1 TolC family protein [Candidatus Egerieousia sp.]